MHFFGCGGDIMKKVERKWMWFWIILLSVILIIVLFFWIEYEASRGKYQCAFQKMHGDIRVSGEYPLDIACVVTGDYDSFRRSLSRKGKMDVQLVGCKDFRISKTQIQLAGCSRFTVPGKRKGVFILTLTLKPNRKESMETLKKIRLMGQTFRIGSVTLLNTSRYSGKLQVKSANVLYVGFGVDENEFAVRNAGKSNLTIQDVDYGSFNDRIESRHYRLPVRIAPKETISLKAKLKIHGMDAYFVTPLVKYRSADGTDYNLFVDTCRYGVISDKKSVSQFLKNESGR